MRKHLCFLALCVLGLVSLAVPAAAAAQNTVCRLACMAKVQYAPQLLALQHGWFRAEGIEVAGVNLGMTTGISATEALVSGSADVAVMGDVPGLIALASAHPTVLVCAYGGGENMHALIVSDRSGIRTVDDLRGKRIGCHFGSSTHGGLHLFLARHNLASSVTLVNTPQKNLEEALLSGSIDAFAASEPAPSLALARVPGARQLATLSGLGNSYPLVMVASRAYAQAHPEVLRLLVEGTKKGVDCILADPARAAREIAKLTGAPASMEERTLKTLEWTVRLDDEVLASLQSTADFLHGIRRLRAVPDLPALVWRDPVAAQGASAQTAAGDRKEAD